MILHLFKLNRLIQIEIWKSNDYLFSSVWRCRSSMLLHAMLSFVLLKSFEVTEWLSWSVSSILVLFPPKNKQKPGRDGAPRSRKVLFSWSSTQELQELPIRKIKNLMPLNYFINQDLKTTNDQEDLINLHFWACHSKMEKWLFSGLCYDLVL